MLRFAFNTIGCAYHSLPDAVELIAEAGYQGVTLTLDVHHMNPMAPDYEEAANALRQTLQSADLALVVDTGARFLLDPRSRHEPTLLSPSPEGRAQRLDYLKRAINVCGICGGEAVTFTAGRVRRNVSQANAGTFLLEGLKEIAEAAEKAGVVVALEPEPGHMVRTLDDFTVVRDTLKQMTDAPLGLALDVGHLALSGERSVAHAVKEFAPILSAVALGDMKDGVHRHLPPGEGDTDLVGALAALREVGYEGLISVKLPRDSYRADETVPSALEWMLDNVPSD